jgi:hypothetical protein
MIKIIDKPNYVMVFYLLDMVTSFEPFIKILKSFLWRTWKINVTVR